MQLHFPLKQLTQTISMGNWIKHNICRPQFGIPDNMKIPVFCSYYSKEQKMCSLQELYYRDGKENIQQNFFFNAQFDLERTEWVDNNEKQLTLLYLIPYLRKLDRQSQCCEFFNNFYCLYILFQWTIKTADVLTSKSVLFLA